MTSLSIPSPGQKWIPLSGSGLDLGIGSRVSRRAGAVGRGWASPRARYPGSCEYRNVENIIGVSLSIGSDSGIGPSGIDLGTDRSRSSRPPRVSRRAGAVGRGWAAPRARYPGSSEYRVNILSLVNVPFPTRRCRAALRQQAGRKTKDRQRSNKTCPESSDQGRV